MLHDVFSELISSCHSMHLSLMVPHPFPVQRKPFCDAKFSSCNFGTHLGAPVTALDQTSCVCFPNGSSNDINKLKANYEKWIEECRSHVYWYYWAITYYLFMSFLSSPGWFNVWYLSHLIQRIQLRLNPRKNRNNLGSYAKNSQLSSICVSDSVWISARSMLAVSNVECRSTISCTVRDFGCRIEV